MNPEMSESSDSPPQEGPAEMLGGLKYACGESVSANSSDSDGQLKSPSIAGESPVEMPCR
jgi:hypothetical protein